MKITLTQITLNTLLKVGATATNQPKWGFLYETPKSK